MVTYERLHDHPTIAPSLIGMSLSAFDQLYAEFEVAHAEPPERFPCDASQAPDARQRAVGAGLVRRHRYDLRERLRMTLFWLRCYMTADHSRRRGPRESTHSSDTVEDVRRRVTAVG